MIILLYIIIGKWASRINPISRSFFHPSQLGCVQILKGNIMLFVMVCINSFAKDYLRSSSSSFILSGWYICSNSLGICYLSLELTDYFTHPLNSRSFLLYSQMWELNYPATRKMFCDLSRPKIVSYICNKSKNIVFVSQIKLRFRGLNYFNHSFLNYSISSCGVS